MINKEVMIVPEDKEVKRLGIHIKPYLTIAEIKMICGEMLKTDDWCDREIILDQYLLQTCVRESEEFDGMQYEDIKHSGVFDTIRLEIDNIDEIDKYMKQATSVSKEIGEFLRAIVDLATKAEEKMPERKEFTESFEAFRILQNKFGTEDEESLEQND